MRAQIGRPQRRWPCLEAAVLVGVASLCACGPLPDALPYAGTVAASEAVPEIPASAPAYLINNGYGIHIPYDALGITTQNGAWALAWISEEAPRRISGDVFCPPGGVIYAVTQNGGVGSSAQASGNRLSLDVRPYAGVKGSVTFQVTRGPVAFTLSIDGNPVNRGQVVFASGSQLSTVDSSPFRLVVQSVGPGT